MDKFALKENVYHHLLETPVLAYHPIASRATANKRPANGDKSAMKVNVSAHAQVAHHLHHAIHASHGCHLAQCAASYQLSSSLSQNAPSASLQLLALQSRQFQLLQWPTQQSLHQPATLVLLLPLPKQHLSSQSHQQSLLQQLLLQQLSIPQPSQHSLVLPPLKELVV